MSVPLHVVAATTNSHKLNEMAAVLQGVVLIDPRPDSVGEVVEDADDFEGNARLKAYAIRSACQRHALADDSGLVVVALGGEPGVYSSRYAGAEASDEENYVRLLERMADVDEDHRQAKFVTVAVLAFDDGSEVVAEGSVEGTLTTAPRGSLGFGYDPIFVPRDGDGRTFAEMTAAEKNEISHRGRAMVSLKLALAQLRGD